MRETIHDALRRGDLTAVEEAISTLNDDQLAALLVDLPAADRGAVVSLLSRDRAREVLRVLGATPGGLSIVGDLDPSEREDFLSALSAEDFLALETEAGPERVATLLRSLEPALAAELLDGLPDPAGVRVLAAMRPDDATDVIGELPPVRANSLLAGLTQEDADELRELLEYPPDTAGGRMTPDFATISPGLRIDEAIDTIRTIAQEAETVNYVYVAEPRGPLEGVVSMRDLVMSAPDRRVADVMVHDTITIVASESQEAAARRLLRHRLRALPVVADDGRLLGIITEDDVADVLEEEATEDFQRIGAVAPLEMSYRRATIQALYQKRVGWLVGLVFVNIASSGVIAAFEETLEATIALAFFIPLLIDSGGNAGSQAATLMVRALATEDVRMSDWLRLLWKELRVGLTLGATMAIAASVLGYYRGDFDLALVVALTMITIVIVANLIGTMLPLILTRLKIDPATASSPLITSVADTTGLLIYFAFAVLIIGS